MSYIEIEQSTVDEMQKEINDLEDENKALKDKLTSAYDRGFRAANGNMTSTRT